MFLKKIPFNYVSISFFMRICLTFFLIITSLYEVQATDVEANYKYMNKQITDDIGPYLSYYCLTQEFQVQFPEFEYFQLKEPAGVEVDDIRPNKDGNVNLAGVLIADDGTNYPLKSALLMRGEEGFESLRIITKRIKGTSYKFEGKFLDQPRRSGGDYIKLEGHLTKYFNKQQVKNLKVGFYKNVEH